MAKISHYIFFAFIALSQVEVCFSQTLKEKPKETLQQRLKKKFERKISISPSIGLAFFPTNEKFNGLGLSENIYANFHPAFSLGFSANYRYNDFLSVVADLNWLYSEKKYYSMNANVLNTGVKYYVLSDKKRFSPYIGAGLQLNLTNINQQAHVSSVKPDSNITEIRFGTPTEIGYRYDNLSALVGPSLGVYVQAGLDYHINQKYGLFVQVNYSPSITSAPNVTEFFPGNREDLQFFSVRAGTTIKLFKRKPPEVDTNMIYIADELLVLNVPEEGQEGRMLVREGVFDILLREGLKHNVKIGSGNHEVVIDEEVEAGCAVTCYLYDDKGDILASATSTPEGKIIFSDLQKGIYDLVFVLEKPCESAKFKYKFPDPDTQPILQYNTEGGLGDSLQYNIEGLIQIPDSADYSFVYRTSALFVKNNDTKNKKNYDITVMLANEKNQIINQFDPNKDEKFSFKKLAPAKYDIIYKVPDVETRTGFLYTIFDNYKKPLNKISTNSSCDSVLIAESKEAGDPKYTMKGKVTFLDSLINPKDVTLYLVNCFKKIESTKKPNLDGTFTFTNLHSKKDYTVFYQLSNPVGKIEMMYRIEDPENLYKKEAEAVEVKVIEGDIQIWADNSEYDITGNRLNHKGYAVQVGASDNFKSINSLCRRLAEDGFEPISIQVLGTGNLNKRFSFSKSFKLFKVLVGAFAEEKLAIKEKFKLEFYGYDAYVIKHFE